MAYIGVLINRQKNKQADDGKRPEKHGEEIGMEGGRKVRETKDHLNLHAMVSRGV